MSQRTRPPGHQVPQAEDGHHESRPRDGAGRPGGAAHREQPRADARDAEIRGEPASLRRRRVREGGTPQHEAHPCAGCFAAYVHSARSVTRTPGISGETSSSDCSIDTTPKQQSIPRRRPPFRRAGRSLGPSSSGSSDPPSILRATRLGAAREASIEQEARFYPPCQLSVNTGCRFVETQRPAAPTGFSTGRDRAQFRPNLDGCDVSRSRPGDRDTTR